MGDFFFFWERYSLPQGRRFEGFSLDSSRPTISQTLFSSMANTMARSFLQVAATEEVASPLRVVQIEGLVSYICIFVSFTLFGCWENNEENVLIWILVLPCCLVSVEKKKNENFVFTKLKACSVILWVGLLIILFCFVRVCFHFLLPYWHIRKLIIFVNSICLVWSCCYISVVFGSIFLSSNANYFFCFRDFDDYISFIIIL